MSIMVRVTPGEHTTMHIRDAYNGCISGGKTQVRGPDIGMRDHRHEATAATVTWARA